MTTSRHSGLELYVALLREGVTRLSYTEAVTRLGVSPKAADNHLKRLVDRGLLERVSRGNYRVVAPIVVLPEPRQVNPSERPASARSTS